MPLNRQRTKRFFQRGRVLLALLLLASTTSAQLLEVGRGNLFDGDPPFRQKFLRENGIKAIRGRVSVKADLKPIRDMGLVVEYEFDREGRLIQTLETSERPTGGIDTTLMVRHYGANGNLEWQRTGSPAGFETYRYQYDDSGNCIHQAYYREESSGGGVMNFKPKREFLITEERFDYPEAPAGTWRKQFLNDQGKSYREQTVTRDSLGNLMEDNTRYTITQRRNTLSFSYNELNRVQEITDYSNVIARVQTTYHYDYDEVGNVTEEKSFRREELLNSKEFLYDNRLLLSAFLQRNESAKRIRIVRFDYEFF